MTDRSPRGPRSPSRRPETEAQAKWRLIRDILLTGVGMFMLVWQTLSSSPQPVILGAALVLLGLPATLRLEDVFRR